MASYSSTIKKQTIIDATNSEVLKVQQEGDSGDVFIINSTDGTSGNTYFVNLTPNNSSLTADSYQKIAFRAYLALNGSGTQTKFTRAYHGQVSTQDSVIHSGTDSNGLIGFFFSGVHNSTGTVADMMGGYYQATVLAAGSSVNAGTVTDLRALRLRVGYGSTSGTGNITNAYFLNCQDLVGIAATRTITNMIGIRIPDCTGTGITTGKAIKTNGGEHDLQGGITFKRIATATDLTVDVDDYIIGITDTSVARTITLPTAALASGKTYVIKDESGVAATNNITVVGAGGETFDGAANTVISTNYGGVTVYSDGSNWFIQK